MRGVGRSCSIVLAASEVGFAWDGGVFVGVFDIKGMTNGKDWDCCFGWICFFWGGM